MIVEYLAGNQAYVLSALMNEFVYVLSEKRQCGFLSNIPHTHTDLKKLFE